MGIFYTAQSPAIPAVQSAIEDALKVDPQAVSDPPAVAASRTVNLVKQISPQFNPWRFGAALVIAIALMGVAIWTAQQGLNDISKTLMTSFTGFSGLVLGLLGGEAQKSAT